MNNEIPHLRQAKPIDAKGILEIYAPIVEKTAISFEISVPDSKNIGAKIKKITNKYPWLVLEFENRIIGYAYACQHRSREAYQWSVESSVYTHPGFQKKGVAKALYNALFAILKKQGFNNVYAGIGMTNPGSITFHESCGFQPIGVYKKIGFKAGAWQDVGWWALQLNDYDTNPIAPKPISSFLGGPEWNETLKSALKLLKF